MPNQNYQRHSFLGGEVSPALYERADMDRFSKWFSKAENIRFLETGGFKNRPGFVKVADTKYNASGQDIKLLSFSFNDDESFLVELGPSYARFYRNGQPIMDGDEPYELATTFTEFSKEDIKYAQAGDIIFIAHPLFGIYELIRRNKSGTEWEWRKFKTDILPMDESNTDESAIISATQFSQNTQKLSLYNPDSSIYNNVSFEFDGSVIYSATSVTKQQIFYCISELLEDTYDVYLDGDNLYIKYSDNSDPTAIPPAASISFEAETDTSLTLSDIDILDNSGNIEVEVNYSTLDKLTSLQAKLERAPNVNDHYIFHSVVDATKDLRKYEDKDEAARACSGLGSYDKGEYNDFTTSVSTTGKTIKYKGYVSPYPSEDIKTRASIILTGTAHDTVSYSYNSEAETSTVPGLYTLSCPEAVLNSLEVGECVLVKNTVDAQQLNGYYSSYGTYTLGPIYSDGNWRLYTVGNWTGHISIKYSEDNGVTWTDCYKWSSQDANDTPANVNTSGSLETDNLIQFKVVTEVTSVGTKPLQLSFTANNFTANSYYKILFKESNSAATAQCVKNDIGEFTNNKDWRLPVFSDSKGWPQTIAFYQNRLFFGKDYVLYGSKSNSFWDFYEPVEVKDDDPITMSLLSQQVNVIRNLVTQRSFFVFTTGGEFGISSEGALTQSDKYLKPFSSNGSSKCNPVLISDVVLFVDKSDHAVRALKYSLESDGYEAADITLALKYLLRGESFDTSDIIYEDQEALFLSNTGTIWVLKYITDQNVLSWSHWKHAFGKITNICVVPNGALHDLYICVEYNNRKWIERVDRTTYFDTIEYFDATAADKVSVTGGKAGDERVVFQNGKYTTVTIDENGQIATPSDTTTGFSVGAKYVATATLLSPSIQEDEYNHSTYRKSNPFKVWFYYTDSYGFTAGIEEDEKMQIEWQAVPEIIDNEEKLTSGKKSVLIPSSFDHSGRLSFVQEKPYPMEIQDVCVETDFGGQ